MDTTFQPAFLLHQRPFRDTSLVVELLTPDSGRLPAVVKGVRGGSPRMRQLVAALQPFQLLQVRLRGRGEMKTLIAADSEQRYPMQGKALYAAIYLNELTMRVVHRLDPHPVLWQLYRHCIEQLSLAAPLEPVLRAYELGLLEQLGYALVLDVEAVTGAPIVADTRYRFEAERGLVAVVEAVTPVRETLYAGSDLQALWRKWHTVDVATLDAVVWTSAELRLLKQLCRAALAPLLGNTPLKSRELFVGNTP